MRTTIRESSETNPRTKHKNVLLKIQRSGVLKKIIMPTIIDKIKTITIQLQDDGKGYTVCFNGIVPEDKMYELHLAEDNARHAARALTREANKFWEQFDETLNQEEK